LSERATMKPTLFVTLAALLAVACRAESPCRPGSAGVVGDGSFPETLGAFCQVDIENALVTPLDASVVPFDLNTPLFSDYAVKARTVWLPAGTQVPYAADGTFAFPVGTVITKSFGWPGDERAAGATVRWVETRVLVNTKESGWTGASYEWNDAQTEADLATGGDVLRFSFVSPSGATEKPEYLVPSQPQCRKCHANDGVMTTLGPSAMQLDKTYAYATGAENQLAHWKRLGMLEASPTPAPTPTPAALPVWNDPTTGTTEARARAYLQANCSYCHNGRGEARTTGLTLTFDETDPARLGVCKAPVAAGMAAAQDQYDVVPGHPEQSILIHRVTSTEPSVAMPELGRSLEHVEGVALLTAWVKGLNGTCP
jgi:uncharacterized repeat protein (TIGR03806 family)